MKYFKLVVAAGLLSLNVFGAGSLLRNSSRGVVHMPSNIQFFKPRQANFSTNTSHSASNHSGQNSTHINYASTHAPSAHRASIPKYAITPKGYDLARLKRVFENMHLLDNEFLGRYTSGMLGGLTSGAVFYGLNKSNSNFVKKEALEKEAILKRDAQNIHDIETILRSNPDKLSEQELEDLELKLRDFKINFIRNYTFAVLEREQKNLAIIQELENQKLAIKGPKVPAVVDTPPSLEKAIQTEPVVQNQNWVSWGLSGLYNAPFSLYNGLYSGVTYAVSPLAKLKEWIQTPKPITNK